MRFKDLWKTPLVSGLRYDSHITAAKLLVTQLSSAPFNAQVSLTWLQPNVLADTADFQLLEDIAIDTEEGDNVENNDTDTEDITDITVDNIDGVLFAEVLEETEEPDEFDVGVSVACPMVWAIPPNLTYDNLDNVDDIFSTTLATSAVGRLRPASQDSGSIYFATSDIARLISPSARLNDVCMNDGALLLRSHLRSAHSDRYAVLSTWVMANLRRGSDDGALWRSVCSTRYWEKDIWLVPIHWKDPYEHWTLSVVDTSTSTILTFDSLANQSLWRQDVEDTMHLVTCLKHVALANGIELSIDLSGWTASPLSIDILQSNTYDCGLWVLAGITAILRGFDITGLEEADMPWFRKYLAGLVMTLPAYTT